MEKEEKGKKREDFTSKAGKPRWYYSFPVSWPPLDGKGSPNQGMQKTIVGDGKLQKT